MVIRALLVISMVASTSVLHADPWRRHRDADGTVHALVAAQAGESATLALSCQPSSGAFDWQLLGIVWTHPNRSSWSVGSASIEAGPQRPQFRFAFLLTDNGRLVSPLTDRLLDGTTLLRVGAGRRFSMTLTQGGNAITIGEHGLDAMALLEHARTAAQDGTPLTIRLAPRVTTSPSR